MCSNAERQAAEQFPGWPSQSTGRTRIPRQERAAFVAGATWQAAQPVVVSVEERNELARLLFGPDAVSRDRTNHVLRILGITVTEEADR